MMISSVLSRLFTMVIVIRGRGERNPLGVMGPAAHERWWWGMLGQPGTAVGCSAGSIGGTAGGAGKGEPCFPPSSCKGWMENQPEHKQT